MLHSINQYAQIIVCSWCALSNKVFPFLNSLGEIFLPTSIIYRPKICTIEYIINIINSESPCFSSLVILEGIDMIFFVVIYADRRSVVLTKNISLGIPMVSHPLT